MIKPGMPSSPVRFPRPRWRWYGVAASRAAPLIRAHASDCAGMTIGLAGAHQRANAAVALRVLQVLDANGIAVPARAIEAGLARPDWPGRLDTRRLEDGRD